MLCLNEALDFEVLEVASLTDKAWNSGLSFPPTPRVGTRSGQAKSCSRGLGSELFLFRCTLLSSVSLCCKYVSFTQKQPLPVPAWGCPHGLS